MTTGGQLANRIRNGYTPANVRKQAIKSGEWLDAKPFREAAIKYAENRWGGWGELAIQMGYVHNGKPDGSCVKRRLCMMKESGAKSTASVSLDLISYDVAVRLCSALGMAPHEFGF